MLKAPVRRIGGFGNFEGYRDRRAADAWAAYGLGNGVSSASELVEKIAGFATKRSVTYRPIEDPVIGCIELSGLVTLDEDSYVRAEDYGVTFPNEVVKYKTFDGPDPLSPIMEGFLRPSRPFTLVDGQANRILASRKDRPGQAAFRQAVIENYGGKCAVSGTGLPQLLEAAHIQPYVSPLSDHPQNGLCLRVDLHRLFDDGLISVSPELKVEVSPRLAKSPYASLADRRLRTPSRSSVWPSPAALEFHRREVFRAT
ncbi:HNH endonuclease [Phreatobacter cathodiphilus]|nr:HNH endonuclease [Phreatobacter cathodiphilus]